MQTITDIALSRLQAQQRAMDITANNLANADTPGFKAQRVLFSDWLSPQHARSVAGGESSIAYTQDRATYRDYSAGALSQTGNPLDIAIDGSGFFTVRTPSGTRLTRAGSFALMPDGTIADINGNALLDTNGQPLQIAAGDTNISVAGDGSLATSSGPIGQIAVVTPNDPNSLQAEGGRLFSTGSGTTPSAAPNLVQGAVESSNVQPVLELTRMMDQLREFQFTAELVQSENDRVQGAIDKITKAS
jgi:flagellar basal-body rod protein FlgF